MIGMRLVIWIEVSPCVGKIVGAISMFMNVESVKRRNIVWCIERQMKKFCIENYTFVRGVIKSDDSGNVRVGGASVYHSVCIGGASVISPLIVNG